MNRVEYLIVYSAYRPGTRIITDSTTASGLPANSIGYVGAIDAVTDTILISWEDGFVSSLLYGVDLFHPYPEFLRRNNNEQKGNQRNQKELFRR